MISRCYNKNNIGYLDYGGRGISVCDEWRNKQTGLKSFIEWADSHGYKKGLEIDRKINNEGYNPDNCRFVTKIVNCNNRRNNLIVSYKNKKYTFTEFWREFGKNNVKMCTANNRYKNGWSLIDSVTVPTSKKVMYG